MNNKRSRTQRTRELITVMSGCLGQWRSEGGLRGGQNRREVINCRPSAIEPMNAFCIGPEADSTLPPSPPTIRELKILYPPLVRIAQRKSWGAPFVHNLHYALSLQAGGGGCNPPPPPPPPPPFIEGTSRIFAKEPPLTFCSVQHPPSPISYRA